MLKILFVLLSLGSLDGCSHACSTMCATQMLLALELHCSEDGGSAIRMPPKSGVNKGAADPAWQDLFARPGCGHFPQSMLPRVGR